MNTAVMNAALMDQCINRMMMRLGLCLALNVIYKCQECIAHLVLYLKVADGVKMPETTAADWLRQNQMRQEWLANNPDATYIGWTSI
jgi:hypothetical protein